MKRTQMAMALAVAAMLGIGGGRKVPAEELGPALVSAEVRAEAASVTIPFILDHNRIIVEVEFVRPDGTPRKARAWVDTGNPFLILAESLARDLGLDLSGLQGEPSKVSSAQTS
jgi:hypothetical protein